MIIRQPIHVTPRSWINLNAPDTQNKIRLFQKIKPQTIALVALLALFGAYLYANVFVRYIADDYCAVYWSRQMGLGLIPFSYQTWTADVTHILVLTIIHHLQPPAP